MLHLFTVIHVVFPDLWYLVFLLVYYRSLHNLVHIKSIEHISCLKSIEHISCFNIIIIGTNLSPLQSLATLKKLWPGGDIHLTVK
jgi:hypothetical protein